MDIDVFKCLCKTLRDRQWLQNSKFLIVKEQVAVFFMTVCHNKSNQKVADRFQHSGETIHRHFRTVLKAIVRLGIEF